MAPEDDAGGGTRLTLEQTGRRRGLFHRFFRASAARKLLCLFQATHDPELLEAVAHLAELVGDDQSRRLSVADAARAIRAEPAR